jgi:hypothetical protein
VSDVGKRRFVGVVERWLRVPEARDDGRNGSGGLSVNKLSTHQIDKMGNNLHILCLRLVHPMGVPMTFLNADFDYFVWPAPSAS